VGRESPETPCFIPLEDGSHDVMVTDDLGRSATTSFTVRSPKADLGSRVRP